MSQSWIGTTQDRNWFVGCGACQGNAWVKNAAVVRDHSCPACVAHGTDPNDVIFYVLDRLVNTELGWCACGDPSEIDGMMLAYLRARAHDDFPKPAAEGVSPQAELLLAYIADGLGWTEHGSSIGGAWLTEDGREAMENLSKALDVLVP